MKRFRLCIVSLIIWPCMMMAQEYQDTVNLGDTLITDVDLFSEQDPMNMTLTFNIKKYQRGKYKEEYVPVELLVQINDTLSVGKSVRIRARGVFRRGHCSFAPFWLNINKADIKNKHLQDVKKMKVVTHCNYSKVYSEYVLREYLIYKIYNILTPISFRVRLIRMKYVDTGRKNKVTESWAFMIEPEKMLAQRHEAVVIKNDKLSMTHMKRGEMDLASLFQLMIGNADYSVVGRHNMKILGLPGFGSEGYTPVPYDFDYTGFVNASYAIPGENLGIETVRERYFMGLCREEQEYRLAMDRIAKHRDEILDLIHLFPYLDEAQKNDIIGYLESYFMMTESPDFITEILKRTCR